MHYSHCYLLPVTGCSWNSLILCISILCCHCSLDFLITAKPDQFFFCCFSCSLVTNNDSFLPSIDSISFSGCAVGWLIFDHMSRVNKYNPCDSVFDCGDISRFRFSSPCHIKRKLLYLPAVLLISFQQAVCNQDVPDKYAIIIITIGVTFSVSLMMPSVPYVQRQLCSRP